MLLKFSSLIESVAVGEEEEHSEEADTINQGVEPGRIMAEGVEPLVSVSTKSSV